MSRCRIGNGRLGQTEVQHLHDAGGRDLDVGRLQIPVDDALLVGRVQRVGNLARDRQRVSQGERPARQSIGQRLTLDELEHQSRTAIDVLEPVNRADVRVIQRRQHASLVLEPREPSRIVREERRQDLDGDVAMELLVVSAIDLAHPANAQKRADGIASEPPAHK